MRQGRAVEARVTWRHMSRGRVSSSPIQLIVARTRWGPDLSAARILHRVIAVAPSPLQSSRSSSPVGPPPLRLLRPSRRA